MRATKSTGNTRSALGRTMSRRGSSISAPPPRRRDSTQIAPAIATISHGIHANRRFSAWTSKVRTNDTAETTPSTTSAAAPAAAAVYRVVSADADAGAAGPNVATRPAAQREDEDAPIAVGINSTTDFTENRIGPQPRACRSAASVRRPATAKAAAAATTAAATPKPAISSRRSGPSTVAVRRSASGSRSAPPSGTPCRGARRRTRADPRSGRSSERPPSFDASPRPSPDVYDRTCRASSSVSGRSATGAEKPRSTSCLFSSRL